MSPALGRFCDGLGPLEHPALPRAWLGVSPTHSSHLVPGLLPQAILRPALLCSGPVGIDTTQLSTPGPLMPGGRASV